jgi:hypothetical protein
LGSIGAVPRILIEVTCSSDCRMHIVGDRGRAPSHCKHGEAIVQTGTVRTRPPLQSSGRICPCLTRNCPRCSGRGGSSAPSVLSTSPVRGIDRQRGYGWVQSQQQSNFDRCVGQNSCG